MRHHWNPLRPSLALLAGTLGIACAQDLGASEDAADATETGSTSTGTRDTEPAVASTGPGEVSTGEADETTAAPVDTDGGRTDDTAGFIDEPDLGEVPAGFCFGISQVGHLATIYTSGEPSMPACDSEPAPCGGDVVGTWTIDAHCGFESFTNFFADQCPSSTMDYVASALAGEQTLGEDGSYSLQGDLEIDFDLAIDTETCFGLGCGDFGDLLTMQDNNLVLACTEAEKGTSCNCALTISNTLEREGTYEVQDEGLVVTTAQGSSDPAPFCADGPHLTTWDVLNDTQAYPETLCDVPEDCEDALGDAHEEWLCVLQ